MGQHQMVIGQRPPQLSLKPREVLGEAIGAPSEAPIALPLGQVVAVTVDEQIAPSTSASKPCVPR
jgi:hypothetical protein